MSNLPSSAPNDWPISTVDAADDIAPKSSGKTPYITRGTPQFMRVTLALFSAGLATFALLYCVQPLLPVLSQDFGISPATSSLSLSVSTVMLAFGLLFTGPLSDTIGRKNVMAVSLMLAAICTIICAFMTSWNGILIMRAMIGLSLSGVAAVAMSYLSEEIHPSVLAFSMGLYISGNSIGGMSGRLVSGVLTDYFPWRVAIGAIGILALIAAITFWRILPESRHFRPGSLRPKTLLLNSKLHWRDAGLPLLFLEGFLLMGAFVTLFNYIGYRLLAPPYLISQAVVGLLSVVYLTGSYSSPKAGALTSRYGRGPVLSISILLMLIGLGITALSPLFAIFGGMMLFTAGFFAAHSVASSWIGQRARRAKGQASSMYLFSYYLGSSLAGTLGGFFWHSFGWMGITVFLATLLLLALVVSLILKHRI
ncbi:putative transporter [Pectobacterium atrosepticum SCRI1043]|uniref:Transporter n=1 Tax=Pectobacterium atrosepticum (strain SCRI 1043 / ATCC BAA-672) TaxID=218491 RepID=Q6D4Y0_PECAS|nr:MFS transporter [Pectobacterium atrosepticum]GKV85393.1 MFS transporter [Pectobacterium carotovorum subsp. carotovorum]AIA71071.1 membrane protein [Pectobacterium atrosepticum]AIK14104.1 putative transporter [Pectobacterium atrosepticum]ATY90923.1 MFS transporter [Pectobacterium atrosepticum]KMK78908.1 putative transporter [Pectobacterium atrosepticum ICMP 1526]